MAKAEARPIAPPMAVIRPTCRRTSRRTVVAVCPQRHPQARTLSSAVSPCRQALRRVRAPPAAWRALANTADISVTKRSSETFVLICAVIVQKVRYRQRRIDVAYEPWNRGQQILLGSPACARKSALPATSGILAVRQAPPAGCAFSLTLVIGGIERDTPTISMSNAVPRPARYMRFPTASRPSLNFCRNASLTIATFGVRVPGVGGA